MLASHEPTENPYDNAPGQESELAGPDAAYDNLNLDAPREDHEIEYDNPLDVTAVGENKTVDSTDNEQTQETSDTPDVLDGGEDADDDMMDPGAGYQDPASIGVDSKM